MKPKPIPAKSSASWLRRNTNNGYTSTAAKIARVIRYYGLVFLLFATLILWFTPPTTTTTTTVNSTTKAGPRSSASLPADTVVVECKFSTPHSFLPNPPEGRFRIAILGADARRKGSSAEAFLELVRTRFYDSNYTFRVIKGFVVQWGVRSDETIHSTPAKSRILESDTAAVPEGSSVSGSLEEDATGTVADRVGLLRRKENRRGTITMIAGGTGQVFVNLGDNRRLDKEKTIPFGVILEDESGESDEAATKSSGMRLIDRIYNGYKGGQGQIPALKNGGIASKFPEMGRIDECYRLE
eukprot:jgi/Psemu1/288879/fgenesh1_pg.295_\